MVELAYWKGLSQSEIAERLEHPARDRQDADAERPAPARGPAGGRVLVSGRRLRRADRPGRSRPRTASGCCACTSCSSPRGRRPRCRRSWRASRRRCARCLPPPRGAALLIAAALALAAFAAGWLVGGPDPGFDVRAARGDARDGAAPRRARDRARLRRRRGQLADARRGFAGSSRSRGRLLRAAPDQGRQSRSSPAAPSTSATTARDRPARRVLRPAQLRRLGRPPVAATTRRLVQTTLGRLKTKARYGCSR